MLGGRGTLTALAVGAAMLVVVPAETAQAATCPFAGTDVRTWIGAPGNTWHNGANWSPNGTPDATTRVCIPDASSVDMGGPTQVDVPAFWVGENSSLAVHDGAGLFAMSHTVDSVVEQGSSIEVTAGLLGGEGVLRVKGEVSIASPGAFTAALTSTPASLQQTQPGTLVVEQSGQLSFPEQGVGVRRGYQVHVLGTAELTGSGFIAADSGTAFNIHSTGVLDIASDLGYYPGNTGTATKSGLVNGGLVRKSAGNSVSVIDAVYQEVGTGAVEVKSGTLALPDGNTHPAQVGASATLATGKCAGQPPDPCSLTTVPAQDQQSVSFRVPGSDANGAKVQIREEAPREFTAHADGLATPPSDPALITMRLGQGLAGTSDPAALDVVHVDDRGVETVLRACPAVGLPAGVTNCVDTAASIWDGANVYKVVRTTDTSRYICRKEDTVPPVFLTAPAPAKAKVKLGKPVVVTATVNEAGTIAVKGKIKIKGARIKGLTLKKSVTAAPGIQARVVLKLKRAQKQKLHKAGAEKGTMVIKVVATDKRGNATTAKLKVKLT